MPLNVKEVLLEAADFYKNNFNSLISLSLCYVLVMGPIVMLVNFSDQISITVTDESVVTFLMVSIMSATFVWLVLLIIFGPRFFLATMVLIHSLMNGQQINLRMAYKMTKGKYWAIVGRMLVIGILAFGGQAFLASLLGLGFNIYFSLIFIAVVLSYFYLIYPLIALESNTKDALKRSSEMITGNFIPVFILYFLTTTLLNIVDNAVRDVLPNNLGILLVTGIVFWVLMFFLFPFAETVCVVVYRKLKGVEEPEEAEGFTSDEMNHNQDAF